MPWKWSTQPMPQSVVGLEDHLRVGVSRRTVAGAFELLAQLVVVVDAPVEGDREPELGIVHRLLPACVRSMIASRR